MSLATALALLLTVGANVLLARWQWRRGHRAGYAERGHDVQAQERDWLELGFRWGGIAERQTQREKQKATL